MRAWLLLFAHVHETPLSKPWIRHCTLILPLQKLEKEATRLISEQPTSEGLISEKQAEILENWEALTERADNRKANLEQSRELQRFLADLRDLVSALASFYLAKEFVVN